MADLAVTEGSGLPVESGFLSRFARAQYAALMAMRGRMFVNSLRSNHGVFEFSARAVAYMTYGMLGLGLATGAGATALSLVSRKEWALLPIEFWVVFFIWQSIAVALASFQEQYDMSAVLRFPVSFGSFYALFLIFGLVDASTLLGVFCCGGILAGITVASPGLFGWAFLALGGFAVFNILLVRAVLAWVDRWLARRRSREIVSVLFLVALVGLQFLNPALHHPMYDDQPHHRGSHSAASKLSEEVKPWVRTLDIAQAWLPPGLAAVEMQDADDGRPARSLGLLGLTGFFTFAAAGWLGLRLRAEFRGENLGESPSRKENATRGSDWRVGGGPVAAVFEKEVRTLSRAMPQVYSLVVPVVMVFVIGGLFRTGHGVTHRPFQFALPICVAYGLLGFTQILYNNLGGEGKGIQMLFIAPVPVRTFLLGKNLFHAILYTIVAATAVLLATLRLGWPEPAVMAATLGWIVFALPANLAAGNLLSVTMAYRVNLGRIGRQSGSQANSLLSMLIQTGILGIGSGVLLLCATLGKVWWACPILLLLAVIATIVWWKLLQKSDVLANARRDSMVARLAKTE